MSKARANSSPELLPVLNIDGQDDSTSEGLTASVKQLLKLVQEHTESGNEDDDPKKPQRVAGILNLLEELKSIFDPTLTNQQISCRRNDGESELRRFTDPRSTQIPREKTALEENQTLKKELMASLTARKSLERMFSSLGKEKEIMAAELARKVQELNGMEEHLNDLKAQNELLLAKVQACANEHKEKNLQGKAALQERNKELSEQLLKSLDSYRALKRKLRDAQEEKAGVQAKMAGIEEEISSGLDRIRIFRQQFAGKRGQRTDLGDIDEQLSAVERIFRRFETKTVGKYSAVT